VVAAVICLSSLRLPPSRKKEKILSRTSTRSVDSRTFSTRAHLVAVSSTKKVTGRERTKKIMSKPNSVVFFLFGALIPIVVLLPDNLVCVGDRLVEGPDGETRHTL